MTTLYYAIVVISPSNLPIVFRKPTNLPFVTPIGTGYHINFVNGGFGFVNGYSDLEDGDFYIFLSPTDPKNLELPTMHHRHRINYFVLPDKEFQDNKEALNSDGWAVGDPYTRMDSFDSYPPPFNLNRP